MAETVIDRQSIYETSGLNEFEIDLVESYLERDNDGCFSETSAFVKLMDYFCDTREMPYAIASQSLRSPENTEAPDDWIVEYLQTCS